MAILGFFFGIMVLILVLIALVFVGVASLLLAPFRRRERQEHQQQQADKDLLETIQCPHCGIYVAEAPKVVNGLCQTCGKVVADEV